MAAPWNAIPRRSHKRIDCHQRPTPFQEPTNRPQPPPSCSLSRNKMFRTLSYVVVMGWMLHEKGARALQTVQPPPPHSLSSPSSADLYMPDTLLPPPHNRVASSTHRLSRLDVQRASNHVKRFVETRLESDLHLIKHTAPLTFLSGTGVNDDLDGSETHRAVHFTVPNRDAPRGMITPLRPIHSGAAAASKDPTSSPYEMECEVVQSLAKWKRLMLARLAVPIGQGIYCDSTSIRKGYKGDVTHSIVADQWDFEIRLAPESRTVQQLEQYVRTLWKIITDAEKSVLQAFPEVLLPGHPTSHWRLPHDLKFVTSQQLHDWYPGMDARERETAAVKKWGAIFVHGMGWPMADGSAPEEVRAPDYDDWNLNGDIVVLHPLTEYRHELCSLGVRVDGPTLLQQLAHRRGGGKGSSSDDDVQSSLTPYHRAVVDRKVPPSFGGGLGISRLLMLLLRTAHIGEVHVGVWHDLHHLQAQKAEIDLIPDRIVHLLSNDNGVIDDNNNNIGAGEGPYRDG